MAHKQIDVAVQAFNRLRAPLVVVGDGPELRRLRKLAGPTVRFTGRAAGRAGRGADALGPRDGGHGRGGVRDRRGRVARIRPAR